MSVKNLTLPFLITCLCTLHLVSAQQNFMPGSVITRAGDHLKGDIDYQNWSSNPDKIRFRDYAQKLHEFSPMDLSSFSVANERYVSAIVKTEVSSRNSRDLDYSPKLRIDVDTVFLHTLVEGHKSLYSYKDEAGRENFYIGDGGSYRLLEYKRYQGESAMGSTRIINNYRFRNQLSLYLNDCPDIQNRLANLKYLAPGLTKVFNHYYACTGQAADFGRQTESNSTNWGIVAGAAYTKVKFKGEETEELTNGDSSPSLTPLAGVFLDLGMPRNSGRLSFYNEFLLSSLKYQNSTHTEVHEDNYSDHEIDLTVLNLGLKSMLRYKYHKGAVDLFVNAGIGLGYNVFLQNQISTTNHLFTQVRTTYKNVMPPQSYNARAMAGLGASMKQWSVELRYEMVSSLSNSVYFSAYPQSVELLLGYRF